MNDAVGLGRAGQIQGDADVSSAQGPPAKRG